MSEWGSLDCAKSSNTPLLSRVVVLVCVTMQMRDSQVVRFRVIQQLMVMTSTDIVDQSLSMLVLQVILRLKVPVLILMVQLGALKTHSPVL